MEGRGVINTFQLAPNLLHKRRKIVHVQDGKKNKGERERGEKGGKKRDDSEKKGGKGE